MCGLFPNAVYVLCCFWALCGGASASEQEVARLKARVEQLKDENKALRAEVTRLKDELYKVPGGKSDEARLATDVRRLAELQKALQKNPGDPKVRQGAEELAKRIAPRHPGKLVWEVLQSTGVLKDGMSLQEAEKLLGPATAKSDREVEWYFNPNHSHVAPNLTASVTKAGLSAWKIDRRQAKTGQEREYSGRENRLPDGRIGTAHHPGQRETVGTRRAAESRLRRGLNFDPPAPEAPYNSACHAVPMKNAESKLPPCGRKV